MAHAGKWKLKLIDGGKGRRTGIYTAAVDFDEKLAAICYNAPEHGSGYYEAASWISKESRTKSYRKIDSGYEYGGSLMLTGFMHSNIIVTNIGIDAPQNKASWAREVTPAVIDSAAAVLAGLSKELLPQGARITVKRQRLGGVPEKILSLDSYYKKFQQMQGEAPKAHRAKPRMKKKAAAKKPRRRRPR